MGDCQYCVTKKVKCCGSETVREIPWCRKHDRPVNSHICSECKKMGWIDKVGNIASGYAEMGIEAVMPPTKKKKNKRAFVQKRLVACGRCQYRTYLKIQQYNQWIRDNGGYAKFIAELSRLEQWPDLPDCKDASNGKMFCMRCKCLLSAKANAKKETCPMNNPDWQLSE